MDYGQCANGCGYRMIPAGEWKLLSDLQRRQMLARGFRRHEARGMCKPCYAHHHHQGTLDRFVRPSLSHADVIEEWLFLRERNRTDQENFRALAPRIGLSVTALEKHVRRYKREQREAAA